MSRPVENRLKPFALAATRNLVWLLCPTAFITVAYGQGALFNSVALDTSIAANAYQPAARPHFGPVQFGIGAYGGAAYDDNVNGSQNSPEPDVIFRIGTNLSLQWAATDRSDLELGTGISYLDYLKYTGNNGVEISPDSALTYAISLDQVTFTLFDQFSYSREVRTEAALANIVALPQLNNNAGIRAEWDPSQWTLLASYSHAIFVSNHADDFLNRSSEYLFGRGGWRFAEATQAGIEASDSLTYYQVSSQNNNQNWSVGAYLEWAVHPSLRLTLRGGPQFYEPNSSSAENTSSLNTYYVSVEANQQITDYLSHDLGITRSLQAGLNQGSSYIEQLSINYSLNWQITQWIRLGGSASYVNGQQPLVELIQIIPGFPIPFATTEDYQQYGGGLQAAWQCTRHVSLNLSYNHWLRNSNQPGRGYSDNSVSCQFNYSF